MAEPSDRSAAETAARAGDRARTTSRRRVKIFAMEPASLRQEGQVTRSSWVSHAEIYFRGSFHPLCLTCSGSIRWSGPPATRRANGGTVWVYSIICPVCGPDEIASPFRLVVGMTAREWGEHGWTGFGREADPEPAPGIIDVDPEENAAEMDDLEHAPPARLSDLDEEGDAAPPAPTDTALYLSPVFIPETRVWRVSDLIEADYNPREISDHELAALDDSIEEFGLVEDVIVNTHPDRYGVVVGGHQRLKVMRARGEAGVPCKEVNLPLERERELNLRLNANGGRFSQELLVAGGFQRDDLEDWGLKREDLEAFDRAAAVDLDEGDALDAEPRKRQPPAADEGDSLEAWGSVQVYFRGPTDRKAFFKLIGQAPGKKASIWFPATAS